MRLQLSRQQTQAVQRALRVMEHHLGYPMMADHLDLVSHTEWSTSDVLARVGERKFHMVVAHKHDQDYEFSVQLWEGEQFVRCYFFDHADGQGRFLAMPEGMSLRECQQ